VILITLSEQAGEIWCTPFRIRASAARVKSGTHVALRRDLLQAGEDSGADPFVDAPLTDARLAAAQRMGRIVKRPLGHQRREVFHGGSVSHDGRTATALLGDHRTS
jgi:hypothetical protein